MKDYNIIFYQLEIIQAVIKISADNERIVKKMIDLIVKAGRPDIPQSFDRYEIHDGEQPDNTINENTNEET